MQSIKRILIANDAPISPIPSIKRISITNDLHMTSSITPITPIPSSKQHQRSRTDDNMFEMDDDDDNQHQHQHQHHNDNHQQHDQHDASLGKLGLPIDASPQQQKTALLWAALAAYLPEDVRTIEQMFVHHVEYSLALTRLNLTDASAFQALSLSVRDRLIERWKDTQIYFAEKDCKRVAYLSMEFLLGRALQNAIINLGLEANYKKAMMNLGQNLEQIYDIEKDAGLGNGGLGRLAACFLDSLATLDYPAWGYGLRYTYGMFHQEIRDGEQVEHPDYWLQHGNPWELERLDVVYPVGFYGHIEERRNPDGSIKCDWVCGEEVLAVAYDTPIPGYNTFNTLNIRLWSATPSKEFDFQKFNQGDFFQSIEEKQKAEAITHVLYPNDNTDKGKELRLKQQYFFVSASLKDMLRRFKKNRSDFQELPDLLAVQLNDTHPTLAIVELMRLLVDIEGLSWDEAWGLCQKIFAYTNHTVLPEALERWPVSLFERLLPRHLRIIYDINLQFLRQVEERWPGDIDRLRRMSIIEEGPVRMVRMANLCIVASHAVNGVAALHTHIIKTVVFKDFEEFYPDKFSNKTNGVTPRRWIHQANPALAQLITDRLGSTTWLTNLSLLSRLKEFADDSEFQSTFAAIKRANKIRLARLIKKECGVDVSPDAMFDVQVKRIHEYKRQLMNILSVIYFYRKIKHMTAEQKAAAVPRVVIIGGKAAPGYFIAKRIIKLINNVAEVVNKDPNISGLLKVVFLPNYRVSQAEVVIPGSDLSQQISTAGMEASGTGNMKFAMNGALIVGTLDGANVEIREEIGDENIFIFGALAGDVDRIRTTVQDGSYVVDVRFNQVLAMIQTGLFGQPAQFEQLIGSITHGHDHYLVSYDFPDYLETMEKAMSLYKDQKEWTRRTIMSVAGSGKFSSDRTIHEYAEQIWNVKPIRRPGPTPVPLTDLASSLSGAELLSRSFQDRFSSVALERSGPVYPSRREMVSPLQLSSETAEAAMSGNRRN